MTRSSADKSSAYLVSVVIATYKNDRLGFLEEAVSSVIAQTYTPLEILIVLDGAVTDETRAYLDGVTASHENVRLVPLPENVGPALARNAGIAEAKGDFIAILDADDRAAPNRIAAQVDLMLETKSDVVGCQYHLINESGTVIGEKHVPLSPQAIRSALYLFNPIANSTVLARADVLRRHPYRDVEKRGSGCFGEDYDLWVTLAMEGFVLRNHPDCLAEFRTDPRFLTRRRGWAMFRADLRTKLRTLPLYALPLRPFVALVSLGVAATRLLPAGIVTVLYVLRNRLRFGADARR